MPLTYHNTRTGRTVKVPTPDEAAARSSAPKRARRRQEKLLTALGESNRWVPGDGGSSPEQRPAPAPTSGPGRAVQRELDALVSDRLAAANTAAAPGEAAKTPAAPEPEDAAGSVTTTSAESGGDAPSHPQDEAAPEPSIGDVRAWAKGQGIEVSARGRISEDVIDAYKQAHNGGE